MSSTLRLPDVTVKSSEKNEEYHKNAVEGILAQSFSNNFDLSYAAMEESYDFYNGLNTGEQFRFLQESESGEALPAQWINFNKIKVKIDLLLGELAKKGYEIKVRATNRDAVIRKLDEKKRLYVEMKAAPIAKGLEKQFGMPMQTPEYVPQDQEELDEYFEYNYKETSELIMESALDYIAKECKWDYTRIALFRDILIAGRCFTKEEIVNGMPEIRRIDPRYMVFDTDATDDFLSDASYFGEIRYMTIADAAQKYGLSQEEIKHSYNSYKKAYENINFPPNKKNPNSVFGSSNVRWFSNDKGELRVLVATGVWRDYKRFNNKISKDKYDNEHIKTIEDNEVKKSDNVIVKHIGTWRQATLIGGDILKDWGEIKNQVRDVDNLSVAKCPYKALLPNYINGRTISKTDQLKGLQLLKDITMYNIQLAMARAGAKGFVYDTAQMPESWEVEDVLQYLKSAGIAFINSKKDGLPAQFNQFQQFDMSLSQSVKQYIEISMMIDREMDAVSGINEARQGIVQHSQQTVGVTQSSLFQSNLATETLFNLFSQYSGDIFSHCAGLIKISWDKNKERYAYIIGDTGVDFLSVDSDLSLDDYGVFIDVIPPMLDDLQMFNQIVVAALQAGQIEFIDALKILREKDVDLGIRRFEKALSERKKLEMAQLQQEQAAQAEAQAQQAQIKAMSDADKVDKQNMLASQLQDKKNQGALDIQKLAGRQSFEETALKEKSGLFRDKAKASMKPKPIQAPKNNSTKK